MEEDKSANLEGSGVIAQDHSVAAGQGGVAVDGDVHGDVTVVNIAYQGIELQVRIPSASAIAKHRAALRDQLATDAQRRWGGMSVYIQEEGSALPVEASPYQMGRLGTRENLLQMLHTADRILVLGEPGSGKTVALERLAWELCDGSRPTVPVLVRLFQYAGTPIEKWVQALLQDTGHLRLDDERSLAGFLKEGDAHCYFLFDGLNEVAPLYRDQLIDELVRWMATYSSHSVILTSRPQDELWRRLRGEVNRAVVVQPVSDDQARAYLVAHLDKIGYELYERLDRRLRQMARMPLLLWLIKEAGAAGESIPGNRGELYARFVSRMLRRDTDRRIDAEIPDRVKRGALTDLAYHLSLTQRLSCHCDEAVEVVARRLGEDSAETVVRACRRHGMLAGDETIWFAPHQTVQEHFTALALRKMADQEWRMGRWAQLQRASRRLITGKEKGLLLLAGNNWWMETFVQLAGLVNDADRLAREVARVNPWLAWWCVEEGRGVAEDTKEAIASRSVTLLESERVDDRRRAVAALARMRNDRVVQPLFQAASDPDLEVVGLAVQTLLEMGEAARSLVEPALDGVDRRLRIAAVRYLAAQPSDSSWTIFSLFKAATDADAEVVRLAIQALLARGETVREQALTLAQQPEHALYKAGLAYLEGLLGLPVVWVSPGPFLMGSNKSRDPQALVYELPQHQVTLPGYWIGRFPVTVSQFRPFVEAGGDKRKDIESPSRKDDHPIIWVTWNDALSFCRWLSNETALLVTLPSEAEWEKAARGTAGWIYPWGDEPPNTSRCNFGMVQNDTTRVGTYSRQGDSPYGCADMAGNVWEWTRSILLQYPYDPKDGREDLGIEGLRVLRGGAFFEGQELIRCAYRQANLPVSGNRPYGFRVIVVPS